MPIQPMNLPRFNFDEINPLLTGYGKGLDFSNSIADMMSKYLAQQKSRAELPYAGPQAQATLAKTQAETPLIQSQTGLMNKDIQWYDPKVRAAMALQQAQTGLAGSEAAKNRFLVNNPLFMNPDSGMLSLSLTGKIPNTPIMGGGGAGSPGAGGAGMPGMGGTNGAAAGTGAGMNPAVNAFMAKYFMTPAQIAASQEQAKQNVDTGIKKLDAANSEAANSTTMNQQISRFLENYDKSTFKGTGFVGGNVPSSGWKTGLASWHDFAPEQQADQAAQNIQSLLIPTLHTNKLTNYELQFLSNLKLNRGMEKSSVKNIADYLKAANNRIQEYPTFLTAAKQKGLDPQESETLFNLYKEQRPIIDVNNNRVNDEFAGTAKDYLTDDAIKQFRSTGTYEPPISDADIKHTARAHNMKESDVRKMLKEQGRLK